jgi:hypothetical protein
LDEDLAIDIFGPQRVQAIIWKKAKRPEGPVVNRPDRKVGIGAHQNRERRRCGTSIFLTLGSLKA